MERESTEHGEISGVTALVGEFILSTIGRVGTGGIVTAGVIPRGSSGLERMYLEDVVENFYRTGVLEEKNGITLFTEKGLEIYREIMNVLGDRLRELDSNIIIIGGHLGSNATFIGKH